MDRCWLSSPASASCSQFPRTSHSLKDTGVVGHPGPEWELGTWRWTTWGLPPPAPDAPILLPLQGLLPIPPSSPPNQAHDKRPCNGYSMATRHCLEHSPLEFSNRHASEDLLSMPRAPLCLSQENDWSSQYVAVKIKSSSCAVGEEEEGMEHLMGWPTCLVCQGLRGFPGHRHFHC